MSLVILAGRDGPIETQIYYVRKQLDLPIDVGNSGSQRLTNKNTDLLREETAGPIRILVIPARRDGPIETQIYYVRKQLDQCQLTLVILARRD